MSDVKGVGCGIRAQWRAYFRPSMHSPHLFPGGLNSKKTHANLAFDLAPLAGSGLYLSAIHQIRSSKICTIRTSCTTQRDPIAVPARIRFTA